MQDSSDQDENERDETSGLLTVTVEGDEGSQRLDRVLAVRSPGLSR
ncbi:RluA family pseudouridine synthase, partial [Pandoraea nosoerga]|nr:RluA family pseudouridine synthase [Pandoraea nosoerga]